MRVEASLLHASLVFAVVGLGLLTASGCGLDRLGLEGDPPRAIRLRFENTSDSEYFYVIKGFEADQANDVLANYALFIVAPDDDYTTGAGPDRDAKEDPACFVNEQYWVVRNINGQPFSLDAQQPPRDPADYAVVKHLGPETCMEPGEVRIELP